MKLDVERDSGARCPAAYTQMVANQMGQLMEVLGIASMKVDIADGASTRTAVPSEIRTLDFAPEGLSGISVCAASDLARAMAAAGIVRLSISGVSDDERRSLEGAWESAGVEGRAGSRLAAPPDMNPDMAPVEVDL